MRARFHLTRMKTCALEFIAHRAVINSFKNTCLKIIVEVNRNVHASAHTSTHAHTHARDITVQWFTINQEH